MPGQVLAQRDAAPEHGDQPATQAMVGGRSAAPQPSRLGQAAGPAAVSAQVRIGRRGDGIDRDPASAIRRIGA